MPSVAWPHLRREGRDLFTENARPGHAVYGEDLREFDGREFRRWDPWRSKLAAYLVRDGPSFDLARCRSLLYLGGAHGTTVSHLSDLLPKARIFVIEKSPTAFAALLTLAKDRDNLYPILGDAHLPERYRADTGDVDFLYQDVAQRDQTAIFAENAAAALGKDGSGLLMLKVRSVTQRKPVGQVIREAQQEIARSGLKSRGSVDLSPFAREHLGILVGR